MHKTRRIVYSPASILGFASASQTAISVKLFTRTGRFRFLLAIKTRIYGGALQRNACCWTIIKFHNRIFPLSVLLHVEAAKKGADGLPFFFSRTERKTRARGSRFRSTSMWTSTKVRATPMALVFRYSSASPLALFDSPSPDRIERFSSRRLNATLHSPDASRAIKITFGARHFYHRAKIRAADRIHIYFVPAFRRFTPVADKGWSREGAFASACAASIRSA